MATRLGRRRVFISGLMALGLIGAFVGGAYGNHTFSDVPASAGYHNDVTWLANTGVTAGCGGTKFCPEKAVTRGQAATFFHKFATRTRVGHFSCDAYGFSATSSTTAYIIGASGVYSDGIMACPVHIPDGSTVTSLTASFYDAHANAASVNLVRQTTASSATSSMAFVITSTNTGAVQLTDSSIASAIIDNGVYSYYLIAHFSATNSPDLNLRGVNIMYTYPGIPAP